MGTAQMSPGREQSPEPLYRTFLTHIPSVENAALPALGQKTLLSPPAHAWPQTWHGCSPGWGETAVLWYPGAGCEDLHPQRGWHHCIPHWLLTGRLCCSSPCEMGCSQNLGRCEGLETAQCDRRGAWSSPGQGPVSPVLAACVLTTLPRATPQGSLGSPLAAEPCTHRGFQLETFLEGMNQLFTAC